MNYVSVRKRILNPVSWFSIVSIFYFFSFLPSLCFAQIESADEGIVAPLAGDPALRPEGGLGPRVGGTFKKFDSKFMGKKLQKNPEEKLRDVSNMYEKHFLRSMLKSMRSTVQEGGFVQSNNAEKIFKEQLDEQYVDKWGQRGGIGLSDMIYNQLVDKFGVAMGIKARVEKPRGPISLEAASGNRALPFKHPGRDKNAMSYRIDPKPLADLKTGVQEVPLEGSRDVKAPWAGTLVATRPLLDSQTMIEIQHDNGLKSQVVFKGALSKVSTGQKLQAGDTVGFLSSEAKSLYWTVETAKGPGSSTVSE